MILGLLDESIASGARQSKACEALGMDPSTVQRWRARGIGDDLQAGRKSKPSNALSTKGWSAKQCMPRSQHSTRLH